MISEKDIAILDDYINGDLDPNQITTLEHRLQSEADLKQMYDNMRVIPAAMAAIDASEQLDMLRALEGEISGIGVASSQTDVLPPPMGENQESRNGIEMPSAVRKQSEIYELDASGS